MRNFHIFYILSVLVLGLSISSCKHDPFLQDIDPTPIDTSDNPVDTTMQGTPCDPDLIYFEYDVLPILISNCAFSGCHNAASAEDGVVLESFQTVMNSDVVKAFDLGDSEMFEVITETDPDKKMPPPPETPLTQEQINIISQWILQGADNLECNPDLNCDTTDVSYAAVIRPILDNTCVGCHGGSVPSGGISFMTYAGVKAMADSGQLLGAVNWDAGYSFMPQGGNKLPDCEIAQLKSWIDSGALEN
ncbi:MAG: hypothetical protein KDC34_19720 [Saprospiraceae bacterium]|nr:hypothetical protein [Saprospiraceae bacterium]